MQKRLHIVLLPLFLCVLVNTILISHSYSDCWNSVQSDCLTALNSVMAPKMRWTRSKRLLQEYEDENHNAEREVQEISNDQNVIGSISETGTAVSGRDEDHQIHPRSRRASELRMRKRDRHLDTQYSAGTDDASRFQHCRKRFISSQQNTAAISNQSFSGTSQCLDRGSSSNPLT